MRGIKSKNSHSFSRGQRPPKLCFGQPGSSVGLGLGCVPHSSLWRGTCFSSFACHFLHWVQLSKKLQYPSCCQGNISPWWDVRDDRGRALILESCQATQRVGDIIGAMASGQMDKPLQKGSTLKRSSSRSHSPSTTQLFCLYPSTGGGLEWGEQGVLLSPATLPALPWPSAGVGSGCNGPLPRQGTVGQSLLSWISGLYPQMPSSPVAGPGFSL